MDERSSLDVFRGTTVRYEQSRIYATEEPPLQTAGEGIAKTYSLLRDKRPKEVNQYNKHNICDNNNNITHSVPQYLFLLVEYFLIRSFVFLILYYSCYSFLLLA
jgi:hypothetical protein